MFLLAMAPIEGQNNVSGKSENDKTQETKNPDSLLFNSIKNNAQDYNGNPEDLINQAIKSYFFWDTNPIVMIKEDLPPLDKIYKALQEVTGLELTEERKKAVNDFFKFHHDHAGSWLKIIHGGDPQEKSTLEQMDETHDGKVDAKDLEKVFVEGKFEPNPINSTDPPKSGGSLESSINDIVDAVINNGNEMNFGKIDPQVFSNLEELLSKETGIPKDSNREGLLEDFFRGTAYPPHPIVNGRPPNVEALKKLTPEDLIQLWQKPHWFPKLRCCSPDTKIRTNNGQKRIADIKVGDVILTDNERPVRVKEISRVKANNHKVLRITLNDKTALEISPEHPTSDGRKLVDLKEGDILDGRVVIETKLIPYVSDYTYDILPDSETGNYYANGVLIGSTLSDAQLKIEKLDAELIKAL